MNPRKGRLRAVQCAALLAENNQHVMRAAREIGPGRFAENASVRRPWISASLQKAHQDPLESPRVTS